MSEKLQIIPTPKYTREECLKVLTDGKLAMKLKREQPREYAEIRQCAAEHHGLLATETTSTPVSGRLFAPEAGNRYTKPPQVPGRTFTNRELEIRARISEADVKEFFKDGDKVQAVKRSDPAKYELMREAAVVYDYLQPRIERPAPKEAAVDDGRFVVNAELARQTNLPVETRIDSEQLALLLRLKNEAKPQPESPAPPKPDGNN